MTIIPKYYLPIALVLAGCPNSEPVEEVQRDVSANQNGDPQTTRHCFRNEYLFDSDPELKDVQMLNIEIDGERAMGEYSWLPALKDKRVGRFQGTFDGQTAIVHYEYSQEGHEATANIEIRLEPKQVVVVGENPELGHDATIARAECL